MIALTRAIADAAARDAANRNMRKYGRKAWNASDWDLAIRVFYKLWPDQDKADQDTLSQKERMSQFGEGEL